MRVWDNELLAKRDRQPVADGLLFWLDGRDEVQNKGVSWQNNYNSTGVTLYGSGKAYDRVAGMQCTLSAYDGAHGFNQTVTDGVITLFNVSTYYRQMTITPQSTVGSVRTAELTIRMGRNHWGYMQAFAPFIQYKNNGVPMQIRAYASYNYSYDAPWLRIPTAMTHIVITSESKLYFNGVVQDTGPAQSATTIEKIVFFGSEATAETFTDNSIDIASVRYYDRVLTEAEILKNMQYEIGTGRLTV